MCGWMDCWINVAKLVDAFLHHLVLNTPKNFQLKSLKRHCSFEAQLIHEIRIGGAHVV